MKRVSGLHFLVSLAVSLAIFIFDTKQDALSYAVGSILMSTNLAILWFVWARIIQKKLIALAVSVIVFKYAIFGFIIYVILKQDSVHPLWFSAGIGSLMVTALLIALFPEKEEKWQHILP
jgi:hypothetical protein